MKGRIVDFWDDQHELCTKVIIAVAQAINLAPGAGWVRGDQAIDPKLMQEMERLRTENESLRQDIASFRKSEISFPPTLLGPEDDIPMELHIRVGRGTEKIKVSITRDYVIRSTINLLTKESSEDAISRQLAISYVNSFLKEKK